jgi:signal transduction histidine kinase
VPRDTAPLSRGPSIRYLVLLANAFVLLLPVFAVWFLRLWDGHLVRVTEQQLVAESVLIGEAVRDALHALEGRPPAEAPAQPMAVEPLLPLHYTLEPPAPEPSRLAVDRTGPLWRASAPLEPMLRRAARTNLSGARVLDVDGCVVASSGDDIGACLDNRPEVRQALAGHYAATARERHVIGPTPPLGGLSRRGEVRVFTALPLRDAGKVIGAILMSRTSSSPLEAVWTLRYTVLTAFLLCLGVTLAVSAFLSRRIAQPVQAITAAATAMTRGEPPRSLTPSGFVPAEVATLSAALDRLTTQLTDRAAYIADFAANASHEMKTPITAIRGAVELLQESWETMPAEQRQRFLANVDADAARMERLVTRLLQLARIQSAPDAAEPVAVREHLNDLVARYGERVRLHIDPQAPAEVIIHPDHLDAAVHNLIDNAVRHSGRAPVEVTVDANAAGRLRIRVRDHGAGISPANRPHIFDRFFTTERDHGGTGLGLAIVRAVAETRGGRIDLEALADGTAFTLVL